MRRSPIRILPRRSVGRWVRRSISQGYIGTTGSSGRPPPESSPDVRVERPTARDAIGLGPRTAKIVTPALRFLLTTRGAILLC